MAPKEIMHNWVEVYYGDRWINIEGFILDASYLESLQSMFRYCSGPFCGYGLATKNFRRPEVNWVVCDTYMQKEGIVRDLGIFSAPDEFYEKYGSNLTGTKKYVYENLFLNSMNKSVNNIRNLNGTKRYIQDYIMQKG